MAWETLELRIQNATWHGNFTWGVIVIACDFFKLPRILALSHLESLAHSQHLGPIVGPVALGHAPYMSYRFDVGQRKGTIWLVSIEHLQVPSNIWLPYLVLVDMSYANLYNFLLLCFQVFQDWGFTTYVEVNTPHITPVSMVRFLFGGIRALLRYMAPWLQRLEGYELDDRVTLNMKTTDCW